VSSSHELLNLVDAVELKKLFSDLCSITGCTIGIVDAQSHEIILEIGWRRICYDFHRAVPESEELCHKSNRVLAAQPLQPGEIRVNHCENGLVGACTPIFVDGKHIANLFSGQVLFAPPDINLFSSQAQKYGYNEELYLESLSEVPITDEKRLKAFLDILSQDINARIHNNLQMNSAHIELNNQKKLLQSIAELAPIAIGVAEKRSILWTNPAMSRITGYSEDELVGMNGQSLYPTEEHFVTSGRTAREQFLTKGYSSRQVRWRRKDGQFIDVYIHSTPLKNEPESELVVFTVIDVTEQIWQKVKLQESEERLRLTTEAADLGLWDWNLKTNKTIFNDKYFTMLGYSPDAFPHTFETWKELVHPDDLPETIQQVNTALVKEQSGWEMQFRMRSSDGKYRWIAGKGKIVEFDQDGVPLRVAGIHEDITRTKQFENELKCNKKQLEQIVNLAPDAFIFLEQDGTIINVNEQAQKLTGYDRNKLCGRHLSFLFSADELKRNPLDLTTLERGSIVKREREVLSSAGPSISVEMHTKMMPDGRIQSFLRDITDRKAYQEELLRNHQDLEKKQKELEETNQALNVLLQKYHQEKQALEDRVAASLLTLVEPYLDKLQATNLDQRQSAYLKILKDSFTDIVSPYSMATVVRETRLSPAETQVANLVKLGRSSKAIAAILGISVLTVHKHRKNIRKKLGLTNKRVNLFESLGRGD